MLLMMTEYMISIYPCGHIPFFNIQDGNIAWEYLHLPHCPKNSLNLRIKIEPATAGMDAK